MTFDPRSGARRLIRSIYRIGTLVDAAVMAATSAQLAHVTIGRHSYGLRLSTVMGATATTPVTIGNFCSIAPEVRLLCHVGHPLNLPSTYPFRSLLFRRPAVPRGLNADAISRGPITIGHDVWLGYRATVLSGVSIGTGAVIAAGAIVTRDVEPYAIVGGNPARVIRSRFQPPQIAALLASSWWELSDDELRALESELYQSDIDAFAAAVVARRG